MSGKRYCVLGAGRQGTAIAHHLALHEEAAEVRIADRRREKLRFALARLKRLVPANPFRDLQVDTADQASIQMGLEGCDAVISALPFSCNPTAARAAVAAGLPCCDLGGNYPAVIEGLALDARAKEAGVPVVPDCGLAPGITNLLALYGSRQFRKCRTISIRAGELPASRPLPPLDFALLRNVAGVTSSCFGRAFVLAGGRVDQVEPFSSLERIRFPEPVGEAEAFVTAGGSSTLPFTFEGEVEDLDFKSVFHVGHHQKMKMLLDLGLLDDEAVSVEGVEVSPRALFHAVAGPRLTYPDVSDVVVVRVSCRGRCVEGGEQLLDIDLLERNDVATGFTALERLAGASAAIVAGMAARGEIEPGAHAPERCVDPERFRETLSERGIEVWESWGE